MLHGTPPGGFPRALNKLQAMANLIQNRRAQTIIALHASAGDAYDALLGDHSLKLMRQACKLPRLVGRPSSSCAGVHELQVGDDPKLGRSAGPASSGGYLWPSQLRHQCLELPSTDCQEQKHGVRHELECTCCQASAVVAM